MVDAGLVERVGKGLYCLAKPKPSPAPPPELDFGKQLLDGRSFDEWTGLVERWYTDPSTWDIAELGPYPFSDGNLVPMNVFVAFKRRLERRQAQVVEDAALLDKLLTTTAGNFERTAALLDLRPIHVMLASDIPLDRILSVIRGKHDRRCFPGNPPLTSWFDLLKPVAEDHARFVVARRMVARWEERLASPSAKTRNAPPVQRALSEVSATPRRKSVWAMHHPNLVRDSVPQARERADVRDASNATQAARELESAPAAPVRATAPPLAGSDRSAVIRSTAPSEQHRPPGSPPAAPWTHLRAPPF